MEKREAKMEEEELKKNMGAKKSQRKKMEVKKKGLDNLQNYIQLVCVYMVCCECVFTV